MPFSVTPMPWSPPHCWFSKRKPFKYVTTRMPESPLITGLLMPTPVLELYTLGMLAIASPRLVVCMMLSSANDFVSILVMLYFCNTPVVDDTLTSCSSMCVGVSSITTASLLGFDTITIFVS